MLQAIAKKKINRFLKRLPEDLVTDCVFGGLRYLAAADAGLVLACVFPDRPALQGAGVVDAELWPARRGGREPDALLRCRTADGGRLTIVVEAKWAAYTLDERQALDQWEHFVRPELAVGEALHAIVVDRRDPAERQLGADDERLRRLGREAEVRRWQEKRAVVLWHDVAKRLQRRNRAEGSDRLLRWTDDVLAVLRTLGKHPFDGFGRSGVAGTVTSPTTRPLFFATSEAAFRWPAAPVLAPPPTVFWARQQGEAA